MSRALLCSSRSGGRGAGGSCPGGSPPPGGLVERAGARPPPAVRRQHHRSQGQRNLLAEPLGVGCWLLRVPGSPRSGGRSLRGPFGVLGDGVLGRRVDDVLGGGGGHGVRVRPSVRRRSSQDRVLSGYDRCSFRGPRVGWHSIGSPPDQRHCALVSCSAWALNGSWAGQVAYPVGPARDATRERGGGHLAVQVYRGGPAIDVLVSGALCSPGRVSTDVWEKRCMSTASAAVSDHLPAGRRGPSASVSMKGHQPWFCPLTRPATTTAHRCWLRSSASSQLPLGAADSRRTLPVTIGASLSTGSSSSRSPLPVRPPTSARPRPFLLVTRDHGRPTRARSSPCSIRVIASKFWQPN